MTADAPVQIPYVESSDAPFVYFDIVGPYGVMNGAIQIELAARVLTPVPNSADVALSMTPTGRLRCSPVAAAFLRDTLDLALKMQVESGQPDHPPAAKLN